MHDNVMREQILELERTARRLEPTAQERAIVRARVLRYSEQFLNTIHDIPAYVTTEEKGKGIFDSPIAEEPIPVEDALRLIEHNVDHPGLNPASGGHLGYIPGGGIYYASLGDYLAAIMNRYAGVFYASPGAVRMEHLLIQWMADIAGYPKNSGGNLTSGGSIANLVGIVTARDAMEVKAQDYSRSVIYLTAQAHHSIDKAIRIAGLKECILRYVPVDGRYRMDTGALEQMIVKDKNQGLRPWLIIAAAGTTDTGAVDPLDTISDIAETHGLWQHVDGAYGAFFILAEEAKEILKGMNRSDSLVMDPHKGLFVPYGSGAVIIRDKQKLNNAFWYTANYLLDAQQSSDDLSPADVSPELTKHFRGLRLWLPLKLHGLAPFRAALKEKLFLARYFYEEIQKIPGFAVGPEPDLSVVTYRYIPKKGDVNAFNERLIQEVVKDGKVFLSSTRLNGNFILRLAVLSFRTHLDLIDYTLNILKEKAAEIERTV